MSMFTRRWSANSNYKLKNCIESLLHPYKSKSGNISPAGFQHQEAMVRRHGFPMNHGPSFIMTNLGNWRKLDANITKVEKDSPPSPAAAGSGSPKFNFSLWARCLLASVLSFFLPFWKEKWAKLKMIEGEAEMVIEQVENVAEVAEKVATAADKLSGEVAEKLPDNSKLKKAALVVEHVSEITTQDAHATTEFIHQVEAIKHDVDGLEALVEPIVNKFVKERSQGK